MKRPNSFIPSTVAAMLIAGTAATAVQAAPLAGSASAGLSQLSYRLVDLDEADGVIPWVEFLGGQDLGYRGHVVALGLREVHDAANTYPHQASQEFDGILPNGLLSLASADGTSTALASPDSARSTAFLTADHLSHPQPGSPWEAPSVDTHGYTGNGRPLQDWLDRLPDANGETARYVLRDVGNMPEFRLSANTQIVFEGVLSHEIQGDPTLLGEGAQYQINASVRASVYADRAFRSYDDTDYLDILKAFGEAEVGVGGSLTESALYGERSSTSPFDLAFSNTTSQTIDGHLSFGTYAGLRVTPVPEPGAWALALAGLATAGIAARRRIPHST